MRQEEIDAMKAGISPEDLRLRCARCGREVRESEARANWKTRLLWYCTDRAACDKAREGKP